MSNNPIQNISLETKYPEELSRLAYLFQTYRNIYELPEYFHIDPNVLPVAFEYAKKRKYFVILVLHTKEGSVCFQRSFDDGHLSMNLPGGSIKFTGEDTIISAIIRVAEKNFKKAKITDISPIISLTNRFICTNGEIYEHCGFGIRALLLNDVSDVKSISRDNLSKSDFCQDFPCDNIPHPPARETYKCFTEWFKRKKYSTYTNEIEAQHKVMRRYSFHNKIVKPVFLFLSNIFGEYSINEYKDKIANRIQSNGRVIDVACGDDKSVFELSRQANLFVANDICVDQIEIMKKQYDAFFQTAHRSHSLVFTNHDCLDLPFKDKAFDTAICRNLLHHMNTQDDIKKLFINLKRVAKKILIVEIQDPNTENILARSRHYYYLKFLKDEAKHFYSREDFEKTIRDEFPDNNAKFEYLSTIRGVYMLTEIANSIQ